MPVEPEPKVYIPSSLAVEAMDYQVSNGKPQKHVHVEGSEFYTPTDQGNEKAFAKRLKEIKKWKEEHKENGS